MKLEKKLLILLVLLPGLSHCGHMPKIVILHDPLSAEEHIQLGLSYESQQKWDLALSEYKAALEKGKQTSLIEGYIGNVYYEKKGYASAKRAYLSALEKNPENAAILNNLASLLLVHPGNNKETRWENLKEAEVLVRKAIRIAPQKRPYFLDTLGQIYMARGEAEIALSFFREAEQIMSSDVPFFAELIAHKKHASETLEKKPFLLKESE